MELQWPDIRVVTASVENSGGRLFENLPSGNFCTHKEKLASP